MVNQTAIKEKRNKKKKPKFGEMGKTGTQIFSGVFEEEYKQELKGQEGITTYDKMRRSDPQIRMILSVLKQPLKSAKWFIEPAGMDAAQLLQARFIHKQLFESPTSTWGETLNQLLTCLEFGYSILEKVLATCEDKEFGLHVCLKKLAPRLQSSIIQWKLDDHGGLQAVRQQFYSQGESFDEWLNADWLMVFTPEKEGSNYEGVSILRSSYKPYYFKSFFEKIRAIGIEKMAVGTPVGITPENFEVEEKENFEQALENFVSHERAYMLLPHGWTFDIKEGKFNSTAVGKAIEDQNAAIATSVLAQFIMLGQAGKGGAYALGQDQSDFFLDSLAYLAEYISGVFNRFLIKDLIDINFGEQAKYPKLKVSGVKSEKSKELAEVLEKLTASGIVIPDTSLEEYARRIFELPPLPDKKENAAKPNPKINKKEVDKNKTNLEEPVQLQEKRTELTRFERRIPIRKIERDFINSEEVMEEMMTNRINLMDEKLRADIRRLLEATDGKSARGLSKIQVGLTGKYKDDLQKATAKVYFLGEKQGKEEVKRLKKEVKMAEFRDVPERVRSWIEAQADTMVGRTAEDLRSAAVFSAIDGVNRSLSVDQIMFEVKKATKKYIEGQAIPVGASVLVNSALNKGRETLFLLNQDQIQAYQWSAILDSKTCPLCQERDGKIIAVDDPSFTTTPLPVHANCRCLWVAIGKGETGVDVTGMADTPALVDKFQGF